MSQLPLELRLDRFARFASFVASSNRSLMTHLKSCAAGSRSELLWIWGSAGSGRTHLAQALCTEAGEAGRRAMYIALEKETEPAVVANLDRLDVVALDGVDRVAPLPAWQEPLFALLNSYYRGRGVLLMTADQAPAGAGFSLRDLASRAAGAVVYRIQTLSDEDRLQALLCHAEVRGLELDAATGSYLFTRVKRDMRELCAWLDRLDRAGLVAKRRITIPFVRELLKSQE
jgi:DnaA family protein